MAPGSCVLTLKPVDLEDGSRGAKCKARIVLCGSFVADYCDPSTSNLDAAAFRDVYLKPPKLRVDYGSVGAQDCWKLKKALVLKRHAKFG
eukprot:527388-Amphidinium_carterae.1